jgi:hypothetical protein
MVRSFEDRSLIDLKMVTTDKGKDKFHVVVIEVFDDFTKVSFIGRGYIVLVIRNIFLFGEYGVIEHLEKRKRGSSLSGGWG